MTENEFLKKAKSGESIFIKPWGGLGDCMMATPAIKSLKVHNPKKEIVVYTNDPNKASPGELGYLEVLKHNPYIDRFLRRGDETMGSNIIWLVPNYAASSPTLYYRDKASKLICEIFDTPYDGDHLIFSLTESERAWGKDFVSKYNSPIGFCPASNCSLNRDWGSEKWLKLINSREANTFLLLGKDNTMPRTDDYIKADTYTLREQASILWACDAYVGMDSFFSHLTSALNTPGVILFGDSSPSLTGHDNNINLFKGVPCSPCFDLLVGAECPYGIECLQSITVEEVSASIDLALLKRKEIAVDKNI
jgi:ADP-heptose:LPS heptosyltransferase